MSVLASVAIVFALPIAVWVAAVFYVVWTQDKHPHIDPDRY